MTKPAQAKEQFARVLTVLRRRSVFWDRFASGDLPMWQMKACRAYINDILTEEADKYFMDQLKVEDEDERLLTEYVLYSNLGNISCQAYYYRSAKVCEHVLV